MASDLVNKKVTVSFEVTQVISLEGEVLSHDEKGILLRHEYRKGSRLQFIPADKLRDVFHDERKGRKAPKKSASKPPREVVEIEKHESMVVPAPQETETAPEAPKEEEDFSDGFPEEPEGPVPGPVGDDDWDDDL